jgi:hypothetical protein
VVTAAGVLVEVESDTISGLDVTDEEDGEDRAAEADSGAITMLV